MKTETRNFSCLVGRIQLQRRMGYFLINKYVPSVLIVLMSFISFWIPATAYPARVTLSVTSLLTIVTQQYQSSMPAVSYVVALNIWMLGCTGFVFSTLLEYAIVVYYIEKEKEEQKTAHPRKMMTVVSKFESDNMRHKLREVLLNILERLWNTPIDVASRFIFPFVFFLFMSGYWLVYAM